MRETKRRDIRVIKKREVVAPEPPVEPPATDRSIMAAVDNWIEERNDTREADRTFSSVSITEWRNQNYAKESI